MEEAALGGGRYRRPSAALGDIIRASARPETSAGGSQSNNDFSSGSSTIYWVLLSFSFSTCHRARRYERVNRFFYWDYKRILNLKGGL